MRSVSLFTSFHPEIGGGGVNLRTLISQFTSNVTVRWYYLGVPDCSFPNTICLGPNLIGGSILPDIPRSLAFWSGWIPASIPIMADRILKESPDVLWLLAMNEGIPLGNWLSKNSALPVHISVQDDQARGMAPRSQRYWWMAPLMLRSWLRLMRRARSIDVTSDGMQQFYSNTHQLKSFVCHPYVRSLPALPPYVSRSGELRVGHIGSLYSLREFHRFLKALGDTARQSGKKPTLVLIGGGSLDRASLSNSLGEGGTVEDHPSLEEPLAIELLASCDFVYAMYPFERRSAIFRQTSLPTKLSTYVQCQRPLFAHTPEDSTLASLTSNHDIGKVCASEEPCSIRATIAELLARQPGRLQFEAARSQVYGIGNVEQLEAALIAA